MRAVAVEKRAGSADILGSLMLTIRNLKKSHGGNTLFENASMQINYGERVALVGPNGAGKTTLFSIILGHDDADAGTVERDPWTMVGFLPQEAEAIGDESVLDIATGRATEVPVLEKKLRELEAIGDVDGPAYLEAHAKYEALTNPKVDAKAKKMLAGLGYRDADYDRPARTMSGGWVMRAHLARLLVMEPDLLMLDEPSLGLSPLLTKEIFAIVSRIRAETGTAILVVEQNAAIALAHADDGYIMELGRIVAADSCAALSQKADVREAYLGGHAVQTASGTAQRWKRRRTWR